jgi:hypothetical protein
MPGVDGMFESVPMIAPPPGTAQKCEKVLKQAGRYGNRIGNRQALAIALWDSAKNTRNSPNDAIIISG